MGSSIISLRDPVSGTRVTTAARFQGTNGLVAFDLDTFLNMAKRSRKWQCPHSMRHSRIQELQIDTFVSQILHSLKVVPPAGRAGGAHPFYQPPQGGPSTPPPPPTQNLAAS
jgi:hypothetical protein